MEREGRTGARLFYWLLLNGTNSKEIGKEKEKEERQALESIYSYFANFKGRKGEAESMISRRKPVLHPFLSFPYGSSRSG